MKKKSIKIKQKRRGSNAETEQTILVKKQAERIAELKEEVNELTKKLEEYRRKETEIILNLEYARKKREEYVSMSKVQYALECERVEAFRKKLSKFRSKEELTSAYDNAYSELRKWQIEMERAMASDLGSPMQDYVDERERLDDDPSLNYESIMEEGDRISETELKDLLDQI